VYQGDWDIYAEYSKIGSKRYYFNCRILKFITGLLIFNVDIDIHWAKAKSGRILCHSILLDFGKRRVV